MKKKLIITFIVLLLFLPTISAQVKLQLGEPYVNIQDLSKIRFKAHSDYYELCSLDKTLIPILIKNNNKFSDIFSFNINKEYASLPVKSTIIKSGKSVILPLAIAPPIDLEENTTTILDVITKKEALKRSVIIRTNIKKCYLFDLEISKDKDEICGCDKEVYTVILNNDGSYQDIFKLILEIPPWVNLTSKNETIELSAGEKREISLTVNPPCEEKGVFTISAKAISQKTEVVLEDKLGLTVLPQKECYNTVISADNVNIDYFGENIPVKIKNKGAKDADYSLTIEGIEWYTLSPTDFSLKKNEEKTINLALYPNENVVEGSYNIDIKAKTFEQEFTKSITIKLKSKGILSGKIKFYLNYFKYYIGLGIILLVVILLLMFILKKRTKKRVEEKPTSIEKEKKEEEKPEKKRIERIKKPVIKKIFLFILYLISLALLSLIVYSTFKYKPYYEKFLNSIAEFFATYVLPYTFYLKYLIVGIGIITIIILIIDFFRKRPKKKEVKREKIKKQEETKKIKEINKKTVKRKLKFFEYIYLIFVVLLFLAIIGYVVYKFIGKPIPLDKLKFITPFIQNYSIYFIIGIIILFIVIGVIYSVKMVKKKPKKIKEKKLSKRLKKKFPKFIKNLLILIVGLAILSGIVYSFIYYNLINYIKDFFIMYYPYILMGVGILIILILILHFHAKNIS